MTLTLEDTKSWSMREDAHFNGGKDFFAYLHRCSQQPRLSRYDRYDRATRSNTSTWRVDGIDRTSFVDAIEALNSPPTFSAEEIDLLETISDQPEDRRKEMLANFEIWNGLKEKGAVIWDLGKCWRGDAGRAALEGKAK